jgi:hypothetical protein
VFITAPIAAGGLLRGPLRPSRGARPDRRFCRARGALSLARVRASGGETAAQQATPTGSRKRPAVRRRGDGRVLHPPGRPLPRTPRPAAGDILTDNTLLATKDTDPAALSRAIVARVSTAGHTVLECLGQAATAKALLAVVAARKSLLVRLQDVACVVATTYVTQQQRQEEGKGGGGGSAADAAAAGEHSAAGADGERAPGGGGGGPGSAPRRVMANRLVVLECEPRDPSLLRVRFGQGAGQGAGQGGAGSGAGAGQGAGQGGAGRGRERGRRGRRTPGRPRLAARRKADGTLTIPRAARAAPSPRGPWGNEGRRCARGLMAAMRCLTPHSRSRPRLPAARQVRSTYGKAG